MTQHPLLTLFSAMLVNNIILVRMVGLCPLFKTCADRKTAVNLGIAITFIMVLTTIMNCVVYSFVLAPYGLVSLRILVFMALIFITIHAVKFILQRLSRRMHEIFNFFIPALSTNCAVLAVSLLSIEMGYDLVQGIAFAAGCGFGLTLVTIGFLILRERLEFIPASPALKGYPLQFVAASLMALAMAGFYGFLGAR